MMFLTRVPLFEDRKVSKENRQHAKLPIYFYSFLGGKHWVTFALAQALKGALQSSANVSVILFFTTNKVDGSFC